MEPDHEISFSQIFNDKLKDRGISLKKLADISGIAIKHLESFVSGNFDNLPSAPYTRGYLQRIAPILGFNADEWWEKIKTAGTIKNSGETDALPENRFAKKIPVKILSGALAAILVVIYVATRFSNISGSPQITIINPDNNPTTVEEQNITVRGMVKNGDTLTVNGEAVTLGQDGGFQKALLLESGLNTIAIKAKKLLGKEVEVIEQVVYKPNPDMNANTGAASSTATSTMQ